MRKCSVGYYSHSKWFEKSMQPWTLHTLDQSHVGEVSLFAAVSICSLANTLLATTAHKMSSPSSFCNIVSSQIRNENSSRRSAFSCDTWQVQNGSVNTTYVEISAPQGKEKSAQLPEVF